MACKCKEVESKKDIPCVDEREESFRIAFLNESKKSSRFSAERDELMKRLIDLDRVSKKSISDLDNKLSQLESYALLAFEKVPKELQNQIIQSHGYPPIRLRISHD